MDKCKQLSYRCKPWLVFLKMRDSGMLIGIRGKQAPIHKHIWIKESYRILHWIKEINLKNRFLYCRISYLHRNVYSMKLQWGIKCVMFI